MGIHASGPAHDFNQALAEPAPTDRDQEMLRRRPRSRSYFLRGNVYRWPEARTFNDMTGYTSLNMGRRMQAVHVFLEPWGTWDPSNYTIEELLRLPPHSRSKDSVE